MLDNLSLCCFCAYIILSVERIVMKRLSTNLLILLSVLLLFSCEPVTKTVLTSDPVAENASTTASVSTVSGNAKKLSVRFALVPNATEYQVVAREAASSDGSRLGLEDSVKSVSSADFSGSSYNVTLENLVPGGSYDISVEARNSANVDWVKVYRTTWTMADAAPQENESPTYSIAPNVSKTKLTVTLNTAVGYKYLVTLSSDTAARSRAAGTVSGDIITGTGSPREQSFSVDSKSTYTVNIAYAYITASDESLKSGSSASTAAEEQSVDMSMYDSNLKISYDDESSEFKVSGLPENTSSLVIVSSDGELSSASVPVTDESTVTVKASSFLDGLDHGYFTVNAILDDASVRISTTSVWCFVSPVIDESSEALWQTYNAAWSVSPSIEASYDVKITEDSSDVNKIPSYPDRKIEWAASSSGLSVTGLSSNTSYIAKVSVRTTDNFTCTFDIPFRTKSFAGTYRWTNGSYTGDSKEVEAFEVVVTDAPDDSNYQYYAKVSKNDPDNVDKIEYSMLPLIDSDKKITTKIEFSSPGQYEEENKAYEWNYKKWATMSATINFWFPCAMQESGGSYSEIAGEDNVNYRDYVKTYVTTNAKAIGFSTDAKTITSWEFRERNGRPEIVFHNEGTGLAAIMGIFKNPNPSEGLGQWDLFEPVSQEEK